MFFGKNRFKKYRLLAPGPVQLHPLVLKELAKPMIHHRTPEFEKILGSCLEKLKLCFRTAEPVLIHGAAGSGAMESALVNTLSPGDEILCVVSGKFGERWAKMAQVYGIKTQILNVPWGHAVDTKAVANALSSNPKLKAVLTQACETSTATEHPVQGLAELIRSQFPEVLLMVDAITAIGAMPLPMDEWGLDVVVSGSQKAFMLPTGISFIALSQKAWLANKVAKCPRFYWDLSEELKTQKKSQTFFSSAVAHIRGLNVALDFLVDENLERTIRRTRYLAQLTREAATDLGYKVYSKSPAGAVTALSVPDGVDGEKLRDRIESEFNITLMGGQDQLKGKILRIGHLGFIEDEDFEIGLEALGLALGHEEKRCRQIAESARKQLENSGL